jgi:adhesin transport system outer membrane protein
MRHLLKAGCIFSLTCLIGAAAAAEAPERGLAAALRAVVTHNPAVKGKRAEVEAQRYAIESAEAGRYPTLSGQANNLDRDYEQATLRLQQPLWAFGKIDTAIEQAQAGLDAEQWGLLQVQRKLIEDTAAAYAKLEGIRRREGVANVNIAEHERLHQRIERRQQGQLASEADVRFVSSRLIQARAQLERIQGESRVALTEVRALTQIPVATDIAVDTALSELPPAAEVEAQALEDSADVGYKRERLRVVRLDIKKEKIAALPTLYFRAEHDFVDTPGNADSSRAGFAVEGNVEGMGFAALGRVRGASARLNAAQQDVKVALTDVKRRVNTLMLDRKVRLELMRSQRESVAAVEATMASFLRQYESGRKSWIDVLNTQRELTELRYQLAQLENERLILSLRVAALTGRLDRLAGIAVP